MSFLFRSKSPDLPPDLQKELSARQRLGTVMGLGATVLLASLTVSLRMFLIKRTGYKRANFLSLLFALLVVWKGALQQRFTHPGLFNMPMDFFVPFIGSLHMIDFDNYRTFKKTIGYSKYVPGMISVWLGPFLPACMIFEPEAMKVILTSDSFKLPKMKMYNFLYPWLGDSLLVASGEKWKKHRRLITPSFHFQALKDYHEIQLKHMMIFLEKMDKFNNGKSFDISSHITHLTLDIISESACGYQPNSQTQETSEYAKAVCTACQTSAAQMSNTPFIPAPIWHLLPQGRRFMKAVNLCNQVGKTMIESKLHERKSGNQNPARHKDFLDTLLDSTGTEIDEENRFSYQDVLDEVNTFIFEGHDTTSVAMGWLIFEISQNPHIEKKILDEIYSVLEGKEIPDFDDLKKMKYLDMCIKETLRLHPSVYIYGRYSLEDVQVGELTIPKDTQIVMFPYILHRNPRFWDDPDVFDPERFTSENSSKRHQFAFVPFAAGSRNCIGQHFAMNQLKLFATLFFKKFTVVCVETESIYPLPQIVWRMKNGLRIVLHKRN